MNLYQLANDPSKPFLPILKEERPHSIAWPVARFRGSATNEPRSHQTMGYICLAVARLSMPSASAHQREDGRHLVVRDEKKSANPIFSVRFWVVYTLLIVRYFHFLDS